MLYEGAIKILLESVKGTTTTKKVQMIMYDMLCLPFLVYTELE